MYQNTIYWRIERLHGHEELTEIVAEIYIKKEEKGLEKLKDAGKSLAEDIKHQLQEFSEDG